jgi:AcrR family transcriptional regulator
MEVSDGVSHAAGIESGNGKNRIAIEQASSQLFREQGFHGISVADLMVRPD